MDKKIKVLMVDDEERFRATTNKILIRRGFDTIMAESGEAAMEKLKENPDVIILDIKMAGMDGHETLKEIKKQKPDIPVIMLTGHGALPSARQAQEEGAFDYLTKPCDIDVLAGKIKEFFSFTRDMFVKVIKTAIPVLINESAWSIGVSVYFIAYGFLGTAAIAAAQVSLTISDLIWAFLIGMGNATAVIIGNEIGAEKVESAFIIAKKLLKMEFLASLFLAACYAAIGYGIVGWFGLTDATLQLAIKCIFINAAFIPIRLLGFVYIVGILRSGGDTKFCMFLDMSMVWLIGIPLAFFAVLVLKLPIYWTMAVVLTEEILKVIIAARRFRSKKWINILIAH